MEADVAKPETDRQSRPSGMVAIDANLDKIRANSDRIARLPSKRFYLVVIWTGTVLVSGVILFAEELRTLIGL